MRSISESVEIAASPEVVWQILTDVKSYSDWNPFIKQASGEITVGAILVLRMFPGGDGKPTTFRPRVLIADPARTLCWRGSLGIPGIFDGEHRFVLHRTARGTNLIQSEKFTGLLTPFLGGAVARTADDFRALNQALKHRAEA
ncbi:SRPBCC domain-containing protein [Nonomuraea sediminis]|uniref:SRPBCC domain-containing protein n=1 Tax=Nonomuraea sediminis TaxID=2835864 RepID=UPI001BDDBEB4|nr:SRPBCC domain-containing protein [Nonomuraea sediminis]